jgi:hypothetical protein
MLAGISTAAANDVFYRMCCCEIPRWATVEGVVDELVEAAELLASAGDAVVLAPCGEDNCNFVGQPVAILFAPDVDSALAARFASRGLLEATTTPIAVVLVGVHSASSHVDARKVGDVLRSDRITSKSSGLVDAPERTLDASTTIRADDVDFRELSELRGNSSVGTTVLARSRLKQLFPGIYA